jgi:hypothetical protein
MKKPRTVPLSGIIFLVLIILTGVNQSSAQSNKSVNVVCESGTDISVKIKDAVTELGAEGGTIYLPEGDFQFNSVVYMRAINVIGKGADLTVLRSNGAQYFYINHNGAVSGPLRITGISFIGNPTNTGFEISNMVDFRVDHCKFTNIMYNIHIVSTSPNNQSNGVIDHCDFFGDKVNSSYGVTDSRIWNTEPLSGNLEELLARNEILFNGENIYDPVWQRENLFGSANATFIEDCTFEKMSHAADCFNGGHYVFRHNTVINSQAVGGHGPGYAHNKDLGVLCTEIYNNTLRNTDLSESYLIGLGSDPMWVGVGLRGGSGVIFNNTFINHRNAIFLQLDISSNLRPADLDSLEKYYPMAGQITNRWIWDNTMRGDTQGVEVIGDFGDNKVYDWELMTVAQGLRNYEGFIFYNGDYSDDYIKRDREYFLRAPHIDSAEAFTYTPYTYPHPLREEGSTNVGSELPEEYLLDIYNYPNPFNPSTKIVYTLPKVSEVEISIYNTLGQKITTLFNGISQAGKHELIFLKTNMSSGVYIYEIKSNSGIKAGKMLLLK